MTVSGLLRPIPRSTFLLLVTIMVLWSSSWSGSARLLLFTRTFFSTLPRRSTSSLMISRRTLRALHSYRSRSLAVPGSHPEHCPSTLPSDPSWLLRQLMVDLTNWLTCPRMVPVLSNPPSPSEVLAALPFLLPVTDSLFSTPPTRPSTSRTSLTTPLDLSSLLLALPTSTSEALATF